MRNFIMSIATLLIVSTGCSSKHELQEFKKDAFFEQMMTHFQKKSVTNSLETKAVLNVFYLNPIEPITEGTTRFLIGVYIQNDFYEKERSGLNNPDVRLTCNGMTPLKIELIDDEHVYKNKIPLFSAWNRYYFVDFNITAIESKLLTFSYQTYDPISLQF